MDVRNTRFTEERSTISSPMCTGWRKWRLSTEAVTTGMRAWRMAAMAAARSTRCMTLPPSTLPRPLASLGSASSEYSEIDSRTGLPSHVHLIAGCRSARRGFGFAPQIAFHVGARLAVEDLAGGRLEKASPARANTPAGRARRDDGRVPARSRGGATAPSSPEMVKRTASGPSCGGKAGAAAAGVAEVAERAERGFVGLPGLPGIGPANAGPGIAQRQHGVARIRVCGCAAATG